jgi:hypothetical protein
MGYCVSLLVLSKSATESLLDASEIVLIVSGFVLLFGAVGEYLEAHGKLPRWIKWPKLVFILMVVASLVGEFIGDGGVFLFSRHLQTISEKEFADLNAEAGEARKTAGAANERAAALEREAAWLLLLAEGRHLTVEQERKIGTSMESFAGHSIFVASYIGDAEAAHLGLQIKAALGFAHIKVEDRLGAVSAPAMAAGFDVDVSGPVEEKALIEALAKLLTANGVEAHPYIVRPTTRIEDAITGVMVLLRKIPDINAK